MKSAKSHLIVLLVLYCWCSQDIDALSVTERVQNATSQTGCKLPGQLEGCIYQVSGCHDNDSSDLCRRVLNTLVPQFTLLKYECEEGVIQSGSLSERRCINGSWFPTEPPIESLECGIRTEGVASTLISKGENASVVEYPWHAGLYKFNKNLSKVELFCGGSIITPVLILTAAYCVQEYKETIDPKNVIVAVGKTVRDFSVKEQLEQRFYVTNIYVHPDYRGTENFYAFDIALLELSQRIVIGSMSMPVCRERVRPWTAIQNGVNGTVIGWGKDENGRLNEVLQVVNLSYSDRNACRRYSPFVFRRYITHDKFCATSVNEAGVHQVDSGGGLVFLKPENDRYYIRGALSTKIAEDNRFATFTNISSTAEFDFIEDTIRVVSRNHISFNTETL